MRVSVTLFSSLRIDRFAEAEVELPAGSTVADLLDKLRIHPQDACVVVVNASSGTFQRELKTGDRITLIPPVGGG